MGYPVIFDMKGRKVVVVGAGRVARRKVDRLIDSGGEVVVVAPDIHDDIASRTDALTVKERRYEPGDLEGAFLAFATTGDESVDRAVIAEARSRGIPVNAAGLPEDADFHLPAVADFGDLRICVDTDGASPALSRALRQWLERDLHPGWQRAAAILGVLRDEVGSRGMESERRKLWRTLVADLPDAADGDLNALERWITRIVEECGFPLEPSEVKRALRRALHEH